ncbi:MAG TPA: hypothetical protein VNJ08_02260 [Bacteriovoracaceae bacterium]|nr:hypothetical protein [Bacteriovoracaceae bacterium]
MLNIFITILGLAISVAVSADIIIVGDSHTVGPFGDNLHKNLAQMHPGKLIAVFGHSSSAPVHWVSKTPVKLTGGLNHHLSYNGLYLPHPNQPNWRIPQDSIGLVSVLDNPVYHQAWKLKVPVKPELNTIIFALGANDRGAVSTNTGARTSEYKKRVDILDKMLIEIEQRGLKCLWIGPPSSPTGSQAMETTTHEYIVEGIKERCPMFDSRKFVAKFCDQVHFNCPPAMPMAFQWAKEAADFINANL